MNPYTQGYLWLKQVVRDTNALSGVLVLLFSLWIVLYFLPEVFVSLFHTLLGNLVLVCATLVLYRVRPLYGALMGVACLVLYRFSQLSSSKEGFKVFFEGEFEIDDREKKKLTKQKVLEFLQLQSTINPQKVFDMDILEQQASQEELDYFLKHEQWPWSPKVVALYQQAVSANPYVRTLPDLATQEARAVFNEKAILRLLSYQTKEGQLLLNGVLLDPKADALPSGFGEFPYSSGLAERPSDVIQCNWDKGRLERTTPDGKTYPVDYKKLESILPGFSFVNEKPCNPCVALGAEPSYSCPFQIKVQDKSPTISSVWRYLWRLPEPKTLEA